MQSFQVLVACSANVCRSPLAASVIRSSVSQLGSTIFVSWAGTYAEVGNSMCPQAATYAGHVGEIGSSRQIDAPLLADSDLLLTADRSQRAWLARMDPSTRARTFTLRQGARLAIWVMQQLSQGMLPAGAAPLPEAAQDRLRWLVIEMDAARGAHASWDPRDDDIEDLHSEEDHRDTLDAVARASSELARAFVAVATLDPSSVDAPSDLDPEFQSPDWEVDEADLPKQSWVQRLLGRASVQSAAELQPWMSAEFLGQISASTPTFSHILLTPHPEIEQHLQRALAHADVRTAESFPAIVLVASAREGCGKTATAINLATSYAQSGRSVVLVDADMRESKISAYLGIEPEVGLPDVLAGILPLQDALMTWHRELIHVLPCGPRIPDPALLLASDQYLLLLEQLKTQFDVVIVNAPPINDWTDAVLLSNSADGAVFVVGRGRTEVRDAKKAVAALQEHKATMLGSIMTAAPASR